REAGQLDAGLATVALAGGDLAFETRREVLLVAPCVGPRPLGKPGHGREERGCLEGPAEIGEFARRPARRAHERTPSSRSYTARSRTSTSGPDPVVSSACH